jgi:transcriptional regulator with XRE-family HTH domain
MSASTSPSLTSGAGPAAAVHLDTIRDGVGSDRAIAGMLGVSPSQVSRWRAGQLPDPDNADRLAALALVVELLSRWIDSSLIEEWLLGANAHLGDRPPVYLIRKGRLAEVVGAAEALKAGVYA